MASEREVFEQCGPLHLTSMDWSNTDYRRSAAACLVQGVYIFQRDREENRQGDEALAPPWWKFFNFQLRAPLVDNVDSSSFGAIYEFIKPDDCSSADQSPRFVIAFRGTLTKGDSFLRDLQLDVDLVRNDLHRTSRHEIAIQAVRGIVATYGSSNIWLAGHSLGAAMGMLVGKEMAKTGTSLESFLFNLPYVAAPIERIQNKKVKHGLRFATSVITAGLAFAVKDKNVIRHLGDAITNTNTNTLAALTDWMPYLFVNPSDHLCSEYMGYFEHRKNMEEMGAGVIERFASKHSLGSLVMSAAMGTSAPAQLEEPIHAIPSAIVIANLSTSQEFREAHGIHQWWKPELVLESKSYKM